MINETNNIVERVNTIAAVVNSGQRVVSETAVKRPFATNTAPAIQFETTNIVESDISLSALYPLTLTNKSTDTVQLFEAQGSASEVSYPIGLTKKILVGTGNIYPTQLSSSLDPTRPVEALSVYPLQNAVATSTYSVPEAIQREIPAETSIAV